MKPFSPAVHASPPPSRDFICLEANITCFSACWWKSSGPGVVLLQYLWQATSCWLFGGRHHLAMNNTQRAEECGRSSGERRRHHVLPMSTLPLYCVAAPSPHTWQLSWQYIAAPSGNSQWTKTFFVVSWSWELKQRKVSLLPLFEVCFCTALCLTHLLLLSKRQIFSQSTFDQHVASRLSYCMLLAFLETCLCGLYIGWIPTILLTDPHWCTNGWAEALSTNSEVSMNSFHQLKSRWLHFGELSIDTHDYWGHASGRGGGISPVAVPLVLVANFSFLTLDSSCCWSDASWLCRLLMFKTSKTFARYCK